MPRPESSPARRSPIKARPPLRDSKLTDGGKPDVDVSGSITEHAREWGETTQRERLPVHVDGNEEVIGKYQKLVETYYKSLNEQALRSDEVRLSPELETDFSTNTSRRCECRAGTVILDFRFNRPLNVFSPEPWLPSGFTGRVAVKCPPATFSKAAGKYKWTRISLGVQGQSVCVQIIRAIEN